MKKDKHKEKADKKKKKPIPPKPEQEKDKKSKKRDNRVKVPFIQVDRGGNIFSNFFSNFLRQLKNPAKTGLRKFLNKLLTVKTNEREKKPEQRPDKPADIIGPVKTVFHFSNNNKNDNLAPNKKESLRQRTNQHLMIIKPEQNKEEQTNTPKKNHLRL